MNTKNRISNKVLMILIALFVSYTFIYSTCLALEIKINDRSSIDGNKICLGDIAEFNPANDSRVSDLSAIEITTAPAPDTFRKINRDLILYKVTPHIKSDKDITLIAPNSLTVIRSAQVIKKETLEKIFRDYVLNNSPWEYDQVVIEKINTPPSIALPKGSLDWDIEERHNNNFLGNLSLKVDFKVDGNSVRKLIVSGKISVIQEVIKAGRNINSGEVISAGDLIIVSEKRKYFRKNTITSIEEAIGKRATRRIQADRLIQRGMLETPPMIEKGKQVIIKAENHELLITSTGKALEEGCIGDQIRVLNIHSKKEIIATVKRSNLVEVYF